MKTKLLTDCFRSAVIIYLLFLILFYVNSIPVLIRGSIGMPGVTIVNIMACRVYRNTKSGLYRESTNAINLPPLQFAQRPGKSGDSVYPSVTMRSSVDSSGETNIQPRSENTDKATQMV